MNNLLDSTTRLIIFLYLNSNKCKANSSVGNNILL